MTTTAPVSQTQASEEGTAFAMRAARLHRIGDPMVIETVERPRATGTDVIVSVDSYQYYGTADLYLGYLAGFLRDGGRIGVVSPALFEELGSEVPDSLKPFWEWDFCCFHGPQWWSNHWNKTGKVRVDLADAIEDGWKDWLMFNDATIPTLSGWRLDAGKSHSAMLKVDQGRLLGFSRVVATKL